MIVTDYHHSCVMMAALRGPRRIAISWRPGGPCRRSGDEATEWLPLNFKKTESLRLRQCRAVVRWQPPAFSVGDQRAPMPLASSLRAYGTKWGFVLLPERIPSAGFCGPLTTSSVERRQRYVDCGIVERSQPRLLRPWRRFNSSPSLVGTRDRNHRKPFLQAALKSVHIHKDRRIAEIRSRLREHPNADDACQRPAPCSPAYPEPRPIGGNEHFKDILTIAAPPIMLVHALNPSSKSDAATLLA